MTTLRAAAPGKVNLCLYLGPAREDGLHELVTVIQPLDLADELTLEPAAADEVVCPGVEGENLAARALRAYRQAGGGGASHRLTIDKRVPVAAGMGGGSSDAAAALRLTAHAAGRPEDPRIAQIAPMIGADVPALLQTRATLVTGAGEEVATIPGPALAGPAPAEGASPAHASPAHASPAHASPAHASPAEASPAETSPPDAGWAFVVMPVEARLSAADVYAEADRLGLARPAGALAVRRAEVEAALDAGGLPAELVHNDLQDAARSLCPEIDGALAAARAAGADAELVSGSGPTVVALFADPEAAAALAAARPRAMLAAPAPPGLTEVREA